MDDPGDWIAPPSAQPSAQPAAQSSAPAHADDPGDWITPGHQETAAPQPSVGHDIKQGVGRGAIEGAGMVLGMPADLWHMLDRGYQHVMARGAQAMGILTPEQADDIVKPIGDAEKSSMTSDAINRHLLGLAKTAGADTSEPQTGVGRAAENVTSFLPGAAALGAESVSAVPKALLKHGLLPGATSEAAGQATQGTSLEPVARVLGAVAPGGVSAAVNGAKAAMNPLRDVIGNLSHADAIAAQRLLDDSRAAGAPLTVAEAIQQVTNGGTRLGDIQRVVEQSPKGAQIMRPFMADRPGQVQNVGKSTLDQIAPTTTAPHEVAPQIQKAADATVSAADQARSAAVKPLYASAAKDTVPVADMSAFLDKIDGMISEDKTGILRPTLENLRDSLTETPAKPGVPAQRVPRQTPTGQTIYSTTPAQPGQPRVPVTDIENLDRARKFFRDQMDLPAWAQEAIPKEEGAKVGSLLDDLRSMMENSSGDFKAGKMRYQQITQNTNAPLERSPTGQLAQADTFDKQASILFNPNPLPGSESSVGRAVRDVAKQNPDAARQMVRMNIERIFNEATQDNLPGANQAGAPKFASILSGNTQQAANLRAAVTALPDGPTRWAAFNRTMDIFRAMGKRQAVGSQTEFNRQINEWLKSGRNLPENAMAAAGSPARWGRLISDMYHDWAYGRNTAQLARIFTSGNVSDLRAIATSPAASTRAQLALIGVLGREGADRDRQQQE